MGSLNKQHDLEDIIIEGIHTFGELQALKYQDSFQKIFDLLAYMPTIGRKSERGSKNEHRFLHGSHVIYYRIEADKIVIETIIYSSIITDIWKNG
ncbi:MAG: type II toxin-antitoxin system RelE/ParE family toxin [Nitrospirae bacterium]|nr:type II toxin-antitoxin system RelE/ParE family toxin [Candidatus Manganitrophaceae bacterium]